MKRYLVYFFGTDTGKVKIGQTVVGIYMTGKRMYK